MNKTFLFLLILLVLVSACTLKQTIQEKTSVGSEFLVDKDSETRVVDANVNELDGDMSELGDDLGLDELGDLEQELAEVENLE
ncbi:hypothetical protein HZA97_06260 [Candidatus Woesearchaeota archaeon]|nr:hypothetical protein [Candidatus Woesearchaeota archaeon]